MQDWPRPARCNLVAKLLVAGFALLSLAWVFSNPPGAGPDEAANYIKAVAVGQGELLGVRGPLPAAQGAPFRPSAMRLAWSASTTRWVRVPTRLSPAGFAHDGALSGRQPSYVGTYQPFMYLLPGLATRLAGDPVVALLLARLVTALICLALLATAAWLLATPTRGGLALVGLLLAVTPLVVFLTSVVSASGFEICAGICVFAAVLRIARSEPPPRPVFVALTVAGIILALSRPLGVIWLGLELALLLLLVGPDRLVRLIRTGGPASWLAAGSLLAAAGLGVGWELTIEPHHHTTMAELLYYLPRAIDLLPLDLKQAVGIFGWLDTWMPGGAYVLWVTALGLMLVGAIMLGTRRQRLILGLLTLATLGVALGIGAAIIMPIGDAPLQARYFLAFAITVPLYAGEVIALNAGRLRWVKPAYLVGGAAALAAIIQAMALIANATSFMGDLPDYARVFTPAGRWTPPLGWIPWAAIGLAGCLLLLAAGATAFRSSRAAVPGRARPIAA
jgi:hypothetical protein